MDMEQNQIKRKKTNKSSVNKNRTGNNANPNRNRNNTNPNKNSKRKRKRRSSKLFKRFLLIYSAVFVVISIILLIMLNGILKDYEASEPNNTMKNILGQFTEENMENLLKDSNIELTEFEKLDAAADIIKKKMKGKEVTFERNSKLYTSDKPAYLVKAEDNIIAKVSLEKDGKNRHGFTSWKLGEISFDYGEDEKESKTFISAPSRAVVTVNDVEVSEKYKSADDEIVEETKNLGDFKQVVYNSTYEIEGLINEPVIKATLDGSELKVKQKKDGTYVIKYPSSKELLEAQTENIKSFYQSFGKYIINQGDLGLLLGYTVGNAQTILSDIPAVWAYPDSKIQSTEFKDEKISNLVQYSDECFSVDVYFNLFVDFVDGYERDYIEYKTSMKLIYVNTAEGWKLADLIMYKADEDN